MIPWQPKISPFRFSALSSRQHPQPVAPLLLLTRQPARRWQDAHYQLAGATGSADALATPLRLPQHAPWRSQCCSTTGRSSSHQRSVEHSATQLTLLAAAAGSAGGGGASGLAGSAAAGCALVGSAAAGCALVGSALAALACCSR